MLASRARVVDVLGRSRPSMRSRKWMSGSMAGSEELWQEALQVTRPTLLSDMLEPNMGVCVWAACRSTR